MITDKMNVQELIDYSVRKLVEQKETCVHRREDEIKGCCAYGNNDGQHCGIGWLLDHSDRAMMDFRGYLSDLITEFGDKIPKLLIENADLFSTFQELHDTNRSRARRDVANRLEKKFDIKINSAHFDQWVALGS
jgi:hypothetical protein